MYILYIYIYKYIYIYIYIFFMREHSVWLRGILGYQSVQSFYSAILLTLNGRAQVKLYQKLYIKTFEIDEKVHMALPTEILNRFNIQNVPIWGPNRPRNT